MQPQALAQATTAATIKVMASLELQPHLPLHRQ
jgi:hypothetical protein